jgi:hypothetical protein
MSRIYLGVHYPQDVLWGWGVGTVLALGIIWLIPLGERLVQGLETTLGRRVRIIKIAAAALVAYALNAFNSLNGPVDTSMGGAFFGFALGRILLTDPEKPAYIPDFHAGRGSLIQKAARLLLGLGGLALIYFGLKAVFPGEGSPHYTLLRFLRYGLVAFWAALGAPLVFAKLRLA